MQIMELWRLLIFIGLTTMHDASCVNTTNSNQPFDKRSRDNNTVLGINISKTSVHKDKQHLDINTQTSEGISLLSSAKTGVNERKHSQLTAVEGDGDKIHNNVLYEINKSNQEHSESHNRLTSAVLVVNDADSSSSSSTSSSSLSTLSSMYFKRVEEQESRTPAESKDKLLLHRHKRYLVFPEGSSFQLVFDLIIPIVDYTNFAIMGITCAVAWELPSKPPSEIIENFRNKLNDGTYGFNRRNDSVLQRHEYAAAPERVSTLGGEWQNNNWQPPHSQLSSPVAAVGTASTSGLQQTPLRNAYYTNTRQRPQISSNPQETSYDAASKDWSMSRNSNKWHAASWQRNKWWEDNKDRIQNQWQQNQWKWQTASQQHYHPNSLRNGRNRKLLTKHPKHRIFPVFGKRKRRSNSTPPKHNDDDADDDGLANELNELHMKQHVDSRHTLFAKIEKLYKTRGHNGTACVLRTLCETQKLQRKRRQHQHPDTFVMELLRVIFNLPSHSLAIKSMNTPYVDAVLRAHEIESCNRYYEGCEHPIWQNVQI